MRPVPQRVLAAQAARVLPAICAAVLIAIGTLVLIRRYVRTPGVQVEKPSYRARAPFGCVVEAVDFIVVSVRGVRNAPPSRGWAVVSGIFRAASSACCPPCSGFALGLLCTTNNYGIGGPSMVTGNKLSWIRKHTFARSALVTAIFAAGLLLSTDAHVAIGDSSDSGPLSNVPVPTPIGGDIVDQANGRRLRSEEHTPELQSRPHLVCPLLLLKKKKALLNA